MASEDRKWISIMIVPEDGTFMRKWRITNKKYRLLKVSFWVAIIFMVLGVIAMLSLALMYGKIRRYNKLNQQLSNATAQLQSISSRLDSYEEKERKLRAILGSDLDLPKPVTVTKADSTVSVAAAVPMKATDEFEQALKMQEAGTRRIPTMWPVEAWQLTKGFVNIGYQKKDHLGIDILAPQKSSVVASADGLVTFAGIDEMYGNLVVIDHQNGWETKYGHNKALLVEYGDVVKKGQQIAVYGGNDKSSTGTHLHFAVSYNGKPVNPLKVLEKNQKLEIIGTKK